MANVARRAVLKMMGVAPIAAPVAAKEAAAKMGLRGLAGGIATGLSLGRTECPPPMNPIDEVAWIKDRLVGWASDEKRSDLFYYERGNARLLDGDLAAMRSISPSFAYTRQLERNVDRVIEHEVSGLRRQLRKLGVPFV